MRGELWRHSEQQQPISRRFLPKKNIPTTGLVKDRTTKAIEMPPRTEQHPNKWHVIHQRQ